MCSRDCTMPERLVQDLGDLPELQLVDVAEHDHLPLLFRQRGDELHEAELRLDLFKAGLNVLLRPQGLGAAVSPPQVGAGICRDLVQIRPELSPVRIGVEVPYRLQEGLLAPASSAVCLSGVCHRQYRSMAG